MEMNDEQLDRIARWLDGESFKLTVEEEAFIEELHGDEAVLASKLDVGVPPAVLARAHRRMLAAMAEPRVHWGRVARYFAVSATAAAAVLLLCLMYLPGRVTAPVSAADNSAMAASADESAADEDINQLTDQVDDFKTDLVVVVPASSVDMQIDNLQQNVENFWTDDAADGQNNG
jgi:hypothetical protein